MVGEVILCQDNRLWHIGLPGQSTCCIATWYWRGEQVTSHI